MMRARNRGAAILLVSEDLDELFELADRMVVMFNGELVYETPIADADLAIVVATWPDTEPSPAPRAARSAHPFIDGQRGRPRCSADPFGFRCFRGCGAGYAECYTAPETHWIDLK